MAEETASRSRHALCILNCVALRTVFCIACLRNYWRLKEPSTCGLGVLLLHAMLHFMSCRADLACRWL